MSGLQGEKCSMWILNHTQSTSFSLGKFMKKLADEHISSIIKGSIYYIKDMYIQPFKHVSGLTRNLIFDGSILYFIFAHTAFLLCGAGAIKVFLLLLYEHSHIMRNYVWDDNGKQSEEKSQC